jgi:hypothetical protein
MQDEARPGWSFAGQSSVGADRGEITVDRPRCWRSWIVPVAAVVVSLGFGVGCHRAEQSQSRSDDALYAAEVGIELGKDQLAGMCKSPEILGALRDSAGSSFVALPGLEKPLSQMNGDTLPGGATVAVTVRATAAPSDGFVLRSLGHSPTEDKTVEATVTCAQVLARKRAS